MAFMARCTFPTSLLFFFGLLVLVCFPSSVMAEWSAIAGSKISYTDNVTNFSAARRLRFSEDPSQPTGPLGAVVRCHLGSLARSDPLFFVDARAQRALHQRTGVYLYQ